MISTEENIELFTSILVFEMRNQEYCIHLNEINKIIRMDEISIPVQQEEKDQSIIIINNNTFLKINLYKFLGLKSRPETKRDRIILVEINGKLFGFSVEKIKEIISINSNLPIHKISISPKVCIKGKIDIEDKSLFVVDLSRIVENLEFIP